MVNKKLDINAVILHVMDGVQYKIKGQLIDINESANTCTIKFSNNRIENNIPMNIVYINEGVLDTIKKYGKQFVDWVTEKVKGFIAFIDDAGKKYFFNPINMFLAYEEEQPAGVTMSASPALVAAAASMGIELKTPSFEESFNDVVNQDIKEINKYWTRVMNRTATTDESVEESVKWVNENYYTNHVQKNLNEGAFYTINSMDTASGTPMYGTAVNTHELQRLLVRNISAQLNLGAKFRSKRIDRKINTDNQKKDIIRPLLVWGAAGTGKSAQLKSSIKLLKNSKYNANLCMVCINCSNIDKSSFILPKKADDNAESFRSVPLNWMPFYPESTAEENAKYEEFFAKCRNIVNDDNSDFTGGVLFFDEVGRLEGAAQNTLMGIIDGRLQGQLAMAKSWAIIGASNRHIDDGNQDTSYMTSNPYQRRWNQVTYVPKKEEWLEWADSVNNDEESETYGLTKVPKVITDFIRSTTDGVWMNAVCFGAYDEELKNAITKSGASFEVEDLKKGTIESYELFADLDDKCNIIQGVDKSTWNSAKWDEAGSLYNEMLMDILSTNPDGYTFEDLRKQTIQNGEIDINPSLLGPALEKMPQDAWEDFVDNYLNEDSSRYDHKTAGARLQDIYDALVHICVITFNGGEDIYPIKQMKEHFKWQAIFTDNVCKSIFETGYMPKAEQKVDDLAPNKGGYSWKSDSLTIPKVVEHIITRYPGGDGAKDFKAYLDFVAKNVSDCNSTIETLLYSNSKYGKDDIKDTIVKKFGLSAGSTDVKKLQEFFTIKTNTDEYGDIIVLDIAKYTSIGQQLLWSLIENCKFYQRILNYVKYLCKVAYSISAGGQPGFGFIGTLKDSKTGNIRTLIMNTCGIANDKKSSDTYDEMNNILNDMRDTNKQAKIAEIAEFTECVDIFSIVYRVMANVIANNTRSTFIGKKK